MNSISRQCNFFRTSTEKGPVPFTYPELARDSPYGIKHIIEKPSLGIAISGGGFRACTCATGWMRGLHKIKLDDGSTAISKAKYLATTSGGSWFNAAFSYKGPTATAQPEMDTFFGPVMKPSDMTLAAINSTPAVGSFEYYIAQENAIDTFMGTMKDDWLPVQAATKDLTNFISNLREKLFKTHEADDIPKWVHPWTLAIRKAFLTPYKVDSFYSTVSAAGTNGDIAATAAEKAGLSSGIVVLACTDPDRPYPILMGSVINKPGNDGIDLYPYEFTPLYSGTPSPFPRSSPPLGGGYIEPSALHATPGALQDSMEAGGTGVVEVTHGPSQHPVPLAEMLSISSSFLAASTHDAPPIFQEMASTEELMNWAVLPTKGVPEHRTMGFADGGCTDNLGVSALLRRKVKCLIVMSANSAPPDDTWQRYAAEVNDVACFFGCATTTFTPNETATEWNDRNHLFGRTALEGEQLFRELFEDVHQKLRNGQPPFHRGRYYVRENKYHNIEASTEPVEVLWIFNQQWDAWEQQLPLETQQQLEKDRKGEINYNKVMPRKALEGVLAQKPDTWLRTKDLYRFPYFTTFSLDFRNGPVHMLSQLCTAVIQAPEVEAEIKKLIKLASE